MTAGPRRMITVFAFAAALLATKLHGAPRSLPVASRAGVPARAAGLSLGFGVPVVDSSGMVWVDGHPRVFTHVPRLGINIAHDARFFLTPALYDPYRQQLTALGYPGWSFRGSWGYQWSYPFGDPCNTYSWPWPAAYSGPPLHEITRRVQPGAPAAGTPEPAPAPPPPSLAELASRALRVRDYERAVSIFERLADEQRDAEAALPTAPIPDRSALRLRALALAGAGRHAEAQAALAAALAQDPALAARPWRAADVLSGAPEMRRIVLSAVRYAQASGTPGAWRYVAHLMDYEGRPQAAQAMRSRADRLERPSTATTPRRPVRPAGPASFRMPDPLPAQPAPSPEAPAGSGVPGAG